MCPDAQLALQRLYWLRSANRGEASRILSRLDASGIGPEQVLGWANANSVSFERAITLVAELPQLMTRLNAGSAGATLLAQVRGEAHRHAQQPLRRIEASALPQGVLRAPPERPANFDVTQVPKDKLILALSVTETNSNPVSSPAFERPADPMFAVWFKTFETLGTRTLTMAEVQSLIRCDIGWPNRANGVRASEDFPAIEASGRGIIQPHEFHLFAGGLRGQPGRVGIAAGQGGEFGLFARATLPVGGLDPSQWTSEDAIRRLWASDVQAQQAEQPAQVSPWLAVEQGLVGASLREVKTTLSGYAAQGLFADPREQQALRPVTDALLASAAGSPERAASAHALTTHFRDRERLLETVSVSSATAEIQMLQTLSSYLSRHKIVVQDATHRMDVVALYGEYRQLLAQGSLTTRGTVEGWLKSWNVPHVP